MNHRSLLETISCLLIVIFMQSCMVIDRVNSSFNNGDTHTPSQIPTFAIPPEITCIPQNVSREMAFVKKVIDGDSILVELNGQLTEVRYVGINAPEFDSPQEKEAILARNENDKLVYGKIIWMVRDVRDKDKYQRLLRFVFVEGIFVNLELVRRGVVKVEDYPPDISCQVFFRRNSQLVSSPSNWG